MFEHQKAFLTPFSLKISLGRAWHGLCFIQVGLWLQPGHCCENSGGNSKEWPGCFFGGDVLLALSDLLRGRISCKARTPRAQSVTHVLTHAPRLPHFHHSSFILFLSPHPLWSVWEKCPIRHNFWVVLRESGCMTGIELSDSLHQTLRECFRYLRPEILPRTAVGTTAPSPFPPDNVSGHSAQPRAPRSLPWNR